MVVEKQYNTKQEVALDIHYVNAGQYMMVTAINLVAPFTVDDVTTYEELIFKLNDVNSSPAHAHYSVADVTALQDNNSRVSLPLRRIMAELNIEIDGAPEGTTLAATITNVASGIEPTSNDADGNYGQATSGQKNVVTIPKASSVNGLISTNIMRLMPTVADASNTQLHFVLTFANGTTQEYDAVAPVMNISGKYILKMKYSELKAYMLIDPVKINDWEEGWTVSGEILNPDN